MAKLDTKIPNLKLPDGNEIPMIGFGCGTAWYKKNANDPIDKKLVESLKTAVGQGYTHLDGAEAYSTEPELGQAIKDCGVAREKLFITTKVFGSIADIPAALDASLKKLGLTYVDLYLIHAPFKFEDDAALQRAWTAMEGLLSTGKVKSIGVSNFTKANIDVLLQTAKIRPAINQIEFNPYLQHGDLLTYLRNKDIKVAAFGLQIPVTKVQGGPLDPLLEQLARKYAVNPGEILIRWALDQGVVAITTSSSEQRMSDYLRVFAFTLNPKEISDISELGDQHHHRQFWQDKFDPADRE